MMCGTSEDADALYNTTGVQKGMKLEAFRDEFRRIRKETGRGKVSEHTVWCRQSKEEFQAEFGEEFDCVNWCESGAKMAPDG